MFGITISYIKHKKLYVSTHKNLKGVRRNIINVRLSVINIFTKGKKTTFIRRTPGNIRPNALDSHLFSNINLAVLEKRVIIKGTSLFGSLISLSLGFDMATDSALDFDVKHQTPTTSKSQCC